MKFLQLHDRYWGPNILFFVGALGFFGITDIFLQVLGLYGDTVFDTNMFAGATYGFLIIVGALLYKAAKKQKFHKSKIWLSVEIVSGLLFLKLILPRDSHLYNSFWYNLSPNIIPEYRTPAIVSVSVIIATIFAYLFIKFKNSRGREK